MDKIYIKNRKMFAVVLIIFIVVFLLVVGFGTFGTEKYRSLYRGSVSIDFWLKRLDIPENNRIVMSIEEINRFNSDVVKNVENVINFNDFDGYYDVKTLKEKILKSKYIHNLPDKNYLNIDGIEPDKIEENDSGEKIEKTRVSYAVAVNRTNLRVIPTNFKVFSDNDKFFHFDNLQQKELKYGEGVLILHYSADKKWTYVESNNAYGWVESEFLAETDEKNFLNYINMKDFLVVISKNMKIADKFLDMGVKIRLKNEENGNFNVLLPEKDSDGNLIFVEKTLEKSDDLNRGFLDYTRFNVIKQGFKYMDEDYGWGGVNNSVDCSGFVNNVYSTFGFVMPRNSKEQQMSAGRSVSLENVGIFERNKILDKTPVGSLLYMKGHIMIYLGKVGEKYFVVHAVGSYLKNKNVINMMKVNIMDIDYRRKSGKTFKKSLLSITDMEY